MNEKFVDSKSQDIRIRVRGFDFYRPFDETQLIHWWLWPILAPFLNLAKPCDGIW